MLVAVLASVPAHGDDSGQPPSKPLKLFFPIIVDPPSRAGGAGIKSGEAFYEQTLRSAKAVRIKVDYAFEYSPRTLDRLNLSGKPSSIKLPAGTMLVLARNGVGEMYCAAATEGSDSWVTFYDVGYCARDTNGDGVLDQEAVVEQTPWRVRVAYEILGTGAATWRETRLAYEPVPEASIPPMRLRIGYNYVKPSHGLFSSSGPMAYFACKMYWPDGFELTTASNTGSGGAGFDYGAFGCTMFDQLNKQKVGLVAGAQTKISTSQVDFSLVANDDTTVNVEFRGTIPAGPGLITIGGRWWNTGNFKYQSTSMHILSPEGLPQSTDKVD